MTRVQIIVSDIAALTVDAIVCQVDRRWAASGATAARVHEVAGPELAMMCDAFAPGEVAEVRRTLGFLLDAPGVLHVVEPDALSGEPEQLAACYRNCLAAAREHHMRSIALPVPGIDGAPGRVALEIVHATITACIAATEDLPDDLVLVCPDDSTREAYERLFAVRRVGAPSSVAQPVVRRLRGDIERLAAGSLAEREALARGLAALDWSSARHLDRLSRGGPAMARAWALFALSGAAMHTQVRQVAGGQRLVSFHVKGPLAARLEAIEHALGLFVMLADALDDAQIDLDVDGLHPLEAVDRLAAALGVRGWYDSRGMVHLTPPPEPPYPTAYAQGVRCQVVAVHCDRSTDFVRRIVDVRLRVAVDVAFPWAPLRPPQLQVIGAWDEADLGLAGEATALAEQRYDGHLFEVRFAALRLATRCLRHVQLLVNIDLADAFETLVLRDLAPGATVSGALLRVSVVRGSSKGWNLEVATLDDATPPTVAEPTVLGISEDDAELAAITVSRTMGDDRCVTWHLRWSRVAPNRLLELRIHAAR
ncbi:MAG TPA: macro domain-containing protein, partial [Nannocystis sp.]